MTLLTTNNYALSLIHLKCYQESKSLLCRTLPVARRALGDNDETTLRMRQYYALALIKADGATLDDLREAVATFEDLERIARRVFGGMHPLTSDIEEVLQVARDALRAHETPPPSESPSLADVVSQFGRAVSDGKY